MNTFVRASGIGLTFYINPRLNLLAVNHLNTIYLSGFIHVALLLGHRLGTFRPLDFVVKARLNSVSTVNMIVNEIGCHVTLTYAIQIIEVNGLGHVLLDLTSGVLRLFLGSVVTIRGLKKIRLNLVLSNRP